ncbi:MAG: hypothetical protein R3E32_25910 [Chitinophagales bacterium]
MKFLFYLFLAFFPFLLSAQQYPIIAWQQQYGGTGDDRMNDFLNLYDGGYLAVGSTTSSDGDIAANNGGQDAWVLRMNGEGNLLWEVAIGGNDTDVFNAIEATEDGGYLLLGTSFSTENELGAAHGDSDIWLVKINAKGELLWSKLFGGSGKDVGIDLTAIGEGQYAIGGYTFSEDGDFTQNRGDRDACILVVDEMGELMWSKTYGGSEEEVFNAVKFEIQSNRILAVGFTRSKDGDITDNKGFSDFWSVQIAVNSGELLQETNYGGSSSDKAIAAVLLQNGEIAILGETLSSNGQVTDYRGQGDLWLIKTAMDGSLIWQKTLGTSVVETAYDLLQSGDGVLLVLGTSVSLAQSSTLSDVLLYKAFPEDGSVIWEFGISGSGDDVGNALALSANGNFCLAGHTDSTDGDIGGGKKHGSHKAWILQVDDGSTGIAEGKVKEATLKVYPNPMEGNRIFVLDAEKRFRASDSFVLYNILGEPLKVEVTAYSPERLVLEVKDWVSGMYFLEMCREGRWDCEVLKVQKW